MENIISLNDFCGGSLLEKANTALKVVLENMQDPNTPWKKSRELNIKLTFSQNESRDVYGNLLKASRCPMRAAVSKRRAE